MCYYILKLHKVFLGVCASLYGCSCLDMCRHFLPLFAIFAHTSNEGNMLSFRPSSVKFMVNGDYKSAVIMVF